MSAREAILAKVRTSIGVAAEDDARRKSVSARLKKHPAGVIPARGQLPERERVELFCAQAQKVEATIGRVKSAAGIPKAVSDYLRDHNLPAALRMGSDPRLSELPWERTRALDIGIGASAGDDAVGLTYAFGGIAESGTILTLSGSENPTSLNFLPETHIVVVNAADIVGDYEAMWDRVRKSQGKRGLPRTVNWITGPSRSGDIQQTILLGAHGPRSVHIIVVDG